MPGYFLFWALGTPLPSTGWSMGYILKSIIVLILNLLLLISHKSILYYSEFTYESKNLKICTKHKNQGIFLSATKTETRLEYAKTASFLEFLAKRTLSFVLKMYLLLRHLLENINMLCSIAYCHSYMNNVLDIYSCKMCPFLFFLFLGYWLKICDTFLTQNICLEVTSVQLHAFLSTFFQGVHKSGRFLHSLGFIWWK